ncbi:hypothetical protein EMEDMD4_410001 [Sinorhizobium medicae]|uniref:Uncharacterized protein n=1 Tax=Sinorhizobium medicae TaxID=110321 RepID=A0A508X316_9HYPH|nr:hypothetical protein EMEDMD4_410001 [Sinorhizobium medicae]
MSSNQFVIRSALCGKPPAAASLHQPCARVSRESAFPLARNAYMMGINRQLFNIVTETVPVCRTTTTILPTIQDVRCLPPRSAL